jgi:hypothetical protein
MFYNGKYFSSEDLELKPKNLFLKKFIKKKIIKIFDKKNEL